MAEEYVKTCPRCNSPDVSSNVANIGVALGLDTEYVCNNCGYTAKLFPETPVSAFDEDYTVDTTPQTGSGTEHSTAKDTDMVMQFLYGAVGLLVVHLLFFTPNPAVLTGLSLLVAVLLVWAWRKS